MKYTLKVHEHMLDKKIIADIQTGFYPRYLYKPVERCFMTWEKLQTHM